MKFKEYKKQYEDVFTSEGALLSCDLSKITIGNGWNVSQYRDNFSLFLKSVSDNLFDIVMKFHWLQRKFFYSGIQRKKTGWNNFKVDNSFATFTKFYVGVNHRIITSSFYFGKVASYTEDFFPNFDEEDLFSKGEKYKFPYKHITIDFLTVVYQMDERLELLKIAEERKMSYAKFIDYIINYVSCYNEEHNAFYTFMYASACPPYVRNNKLPKNRRVAKKNKL